MKRFVTFVFSAIFILSSCLLPSGSGIKSGVATDTLGFNFSEGENAEWSDADIVIEPWYDSNGNKVPAMMHTQWGDSLYIILDMGSVDIETAENMDLSEGVIADTFFDDPWNVWPINVGHTYTFLEHTNQQRVYMYIKSIEISEDTTVYGATVEFDYEIIEE